MYLQSFSMQQQCEAGLSVVLVVLVEFCQLVDVSDVQLLLVNLLVKIL